MVNNLINQIDKEIGKMNLNFIQKSKTEKGIYLLYHDSREDDERLKEVLNKYKENIRCWNSSGGSFERLSEEYGFDISKISESDRKELQRFGKEIITIELK